MDIFSLFWPIIGIVLVGVTLVDIFFMVLHVDSSGVISPKIHRAIWNVIIAASVRYGRLRRSLLALAGPIMLAVTFLFWMVLFTVGFALIYVPFLDSFRAEGALLPLGFIDALYYSGVTGTVLGFGDLTPTNDIAKILSFTQSGIGFALLTVVISYLINVLTSVAERDALAVNLYQKTGDTKQGRQYIIRYLRHEEIGVLRTRLESLTERIHFLQERMHHFPFIDIYYRSREASHDPELMLDSLLEIALTARLLAGSKHCALLGPVAQDLSMAAEHIMDIYIHSHFDATALSKLENATPDEQDKAYLQEIRESIQQALGTQYETAAENSSELLNFAYRARIFMHNINKLSQWEVYR